MPVAASTSDRDILIAFYQATDGPNWVNSDGWLTEAPLGNWYGVDTDASGRVVRMDLGGFDPEERRYRGNGLAGGIPPALGGLSNLTVLRLIANDLSGSIPPELGDLVHLTDLDLVANNLSGSIPVELGGLVNLKTLELDYNDLSGSIPVELGGLVNLEALGLGNNGLTGALPSAFLQLSKLSWFYFDDNEGLCAPGTAGFTAWLSGMDMFEDEGYGGPFCNQADVAVLHSLHEAAGGVNWTNSDGWLDGVVLDEWYGIDADSLGRVSTLDLAGNGLSGRLPFSLGNLAALTTLRIGDNALAGRLPSSLVRTPLGELRYANTELCAPAATSFQDWLASIPQHEGTELRCPPPSDREGLVALYDVAGGVDWESSGNWLTDAPLSEWHGVGTDTDGRVVSLDLRWNGLKGSIPAELGGLAMLETLILFDNQLTGSIPPELGGLARAKLVVLGGNELTGPIPPELGGLAAVEELWLNGNRLTSVPPELGGLSALRVLSLAQNELTSIPPELGGLAAVEELWLNGNRLTSVPPELGELANLKVLVLNFNRLSDFPLRVGDYPTLQELHLWSNELTSVPPELGGLENLVVLDLDENRLTSIPAELGGLASLVLLWLSSNQLTSFPQELDGWDSLEFLDLSSNQFTSFPQELGRLGNLRQLELDENRLADVSSGLANAIPMARHSRNAEEMPPLTIGRTNNATDHRSNEQSDPWRMDRDGNQPKSISRNPSMLGRLEFDGTRPADSTAGAREFANLEILDLSSNAFSGPLPAGLLEFTSLTSLGLADNPGLVGPLPFGLTALERLDDLHTTGTGLCAPPDPAFLDWLWDVTRQRVEHCGAGGDAAAYLTQAVQSREFPVPLVAGKPALLRVFLTAGRATGVDMPDVRATFHLDGSVVHEANIPAKPDPIPPLIDESSLSKSANTEIPGWVIQPGLEVVIDVDPAGTLDPELGVPRRIPETGRMAVDVHAMPVLELTLVPFLWGEAPDSSILEITAAMAADPEGHELLERTHLLLPVSALDVEAHESVTAPTNDGFEILELTEMVRVVEGGRGHYLGLMAGPTGPGGLLGVANDIGSWSSFSVLDSETIAHELGHNRNLYHAPCGGAGGPDRYYPYGQGNIGAWGWDARTGELVPPGQPDFMSYCEPTWVSDYQFTNALRYRLETESNSIVVASADRPAAVSGSTILLWGGLDGEGAPHLRPAFFIDSPPTLPATDGPWSITGEDLDGTVIFSLSFAMAEFTDTDDGRAGFSFALPVTWTGELASITLRGPAGSTRLDRDADLPMTIQRDPSTGRIQGILDGPLAVAAAQGPVSAAGQDLEIFFSRGIPDPTNSRR